MKCFHLRAWEATHHLNACIMQSRLRGGYRISERGGGGAFFPLFMKFGGPPKEGGGGPDPLDLPLSEHTHILGLL